MRLKNTIFLLPIFILIFILTSCGDSGEATDNVNNKSTNSFSKCKYGAPSPIFSKENEGIADHSFKMEDKEGIEVVKFTNGKTLEINQSGCNEVIQTFKFDIKGDQSKQTREGWIALSVEQLRFLGSLGPEYASLSFWGNEIEDASLKIKLGSLYEIQPGFQVKIDKVLSINESILFITLSQ